jgi:hypothetical protein
MCVAFFLDMKFSVRYRFSTSQTHLGSLQIHHKATPLYFARYDKFVATSVKCSASCLVG